MDPGFRTPLVDFFRRGEVAADVRMLAAKGALAPRAHEQLALLVLLTRDADPEIAAAAEQTLGRIPPQSLSAFLARADVPEDLVAFFVDRGIAPAGTAAIDAETPLIETEDVGAALVEVVEDGERLPLIQRLAQMSIVEKIRVAMKGSREERAVLIRDSNKVVAVSVLSSPKLTENEVEVFARMASVSDEILRIIAHTRAWVKNYQVVLGLVRNPKTPVAMSMNLLPRLIERDMRMLSIDRNVPDPLRIAARQKIVITDRR